MKTLKTGQPAPEFGLPRLEGGSFSLSQERQRGPVLAVFFKVSCPTCQYTLPFVERLHQAYGAALNIVGISQDDARETRLFAREYGLTLPLLLDDTDAYPASNAYGLTHVPTLFLIGSDGAIQFVTTGWDRKDFEELNRRLAQAAGKPAAKVFHPGEHVAGYKGG